MKRLISYLLVGLFFAFLLWNIAKNWEIVSTIKWRFNIADILLLAIFLLPIYFINIVSWHMVTLALGVKLSFKKNFRIWMLSNLTRLIPGGIWQYPSRVYLLSQEGVPKKAGITAVIIEGFLNLSLGAVAVFISLYFWDLPELFSNYRGVLWVFLFSPLLVFAFANEAIASRIIQITRTITHRRSQVLQKVRLPLQWLFPLTLLFLGRFFFLGGTLFFLCRTVISLNLELLPVFIGMFALAWLAGYIAFFAPGGFGVFEGSLALLLSFYISFPIAAVLAIVFRLILILSETLFLTVAFLLTRKEI